MIRRLGSNRVYTVLLLVAGLVAVGVHYRYAFRTWFLREDSRYFANGLFSFFDLWSAFATTQNSMGHYRPITKILWGAPEWLGLGTPGLYHAMTFTLLIVAALFLMRLSYLLYGDALAAVLAGVLYALMPTNAKPVYWISAVQDITAGLFVFAALVFRIEQWSKPKSEQTYRRLCLVSMFFALASREVAFGVAALLFLVDFQFKKLRRSWDVLLLLGAAVYYVFLMSPPFERAGIRMGLDQFFDGSAWKDLWDYSLSTFWSRGDHKDYEYPLACKIVSAALLAAAVVGPLFRRFLLPASLLAAAGIVPFLLIRAFSIEYVFLFGAGIALLVTGILVPLLKKIPRPAVFALFLVAVAGYYQFLGGGREIYKNNYLGRSLLLRDFLDEIYRYSRDLPPYRPIEIVDFGPYKDGEARDSHHFIALGLRELIPDRVFLFRPATINTGEGTGVSDPDSPTWKLYLRATEKPLRIRYTKGGFVRD